jgi:Raf kinase inhibitor-like YbhB/YbcL family protein
MRLESIAFKDAGEMPVRFTCDGSDFSPPLTWSKAPPETKSFALLCNDPDAPGGMWRHWAVYDIESEKRGLEEALAADVRGLKQGLNDFGRHGYGGPCPPRGRGAHQYRFILLALDTPSLGLPDGARCKDVERAARGHTLAEAQLTGFYGR